jgi:hypothetical protein
MDLKLESPGSQAEIIHLYISAVTASLGSIMPSPPSFFLRQHVVQATLALVGRSEPAQMKLATLLLTLATPFLEPPHIARKKKGG